MGRRPVAEIESSQRVLDRSLGDRSRVSCFEGPVGDFFKIDGGVGSPRLVAGRRGTACTALAQHNGLTKKRQGGEESESAVVRKSLHGGSSGRTDDRSRSSAV